MTAPVWDLDAIFPGGAAGPALLDTLSGVEAEAEALVGRADALPEPPDGLDERVGLLVDLYALYRIAGPIRVVASGQSNANTDDREAQRADARISAALGRTARASVVLEDQVMHCDEAHFEALCAHPDAAPFVPWFHTLRSQRHLRLARSEEALLAELARDGIQAWGKHYDRISGRLQVDLPHGETVSVGRAKNRLASGDPKTRTEAHYAVDAAWGTVEDDCAAVLTHIVGTRQVLNKRRGCDPVDDSLARNRMSRASLDAMLEASRRAGPLLERYLGIKSRLLGKEKLGFEDLGAPLGNDGSMSWEAAAEFVLTHFGGYHPDLRALAAKALEERWVEAEDRDGKRPGGYCSSLPSGQSRIFMTYGGNQRSMTTLAHELGHAYHNWVLRESHPARRRITSTLAETASVLAENLVRDAALEAATDDAARLGMRDARLAAGASFLMNLPFRYDLERSLYTMRERGELDAGELCAESVRLQKVHYRDALSTWFPRFWADKLHFYISHFAFYNYPYTFGYLFSALVYARVKAEGPSFHGRVVEVLQRSGYETAELLALDVLGLDLTDPDVWCEGWAPLVDDLAAFEALS